MATGLLPVQCRDMARLAQKGPGLGLTDEPDGRQAHGGLRVPQVGQALLHVVFSPAPPLHQLQGAPGMSPGLPQSPPVGWRCPSCQYPSLLSPPCCWMQQGAWRGASGALFSRTGTRFSKSCPALPAALRAASAPLGSHGNRHSAGTALTQPGPCGLSLPSILRAPTSALSAAGA